MSPGLHNMLPPTVMFILLVSPLVGLSLQTTFLLVHFFSLFLGVFIMNIKECVCAVDSITLYVTPLYTP